MSPLLVAGLVFVCVSAAVGAAAVMFREKNGSRFDDRLEMFTSVTAQKDSKAASSSLFQPESGKGFFELLVERFSRLQLLFAQADSPITPKQFFLLSGGLALGGWVAAVIGRIPLATTPLVAISAGTLPLLFLVFRRRRRLKRFQAQLPDALELIGRALRAGHSLASGFRLVADEIQPPLGKEFARVFEESNLGVPVEEALVNMTDRVPNLDLKFFSTAVTLQRQTGGDLAEILDKISRLIRERFQIWGQVQALTGEGRLSGIVLLALPPALFLAVYKLNPDYIMTLFQDPMGTKMLAGAIVLQVLGALVIKKIVNIRV